MSYLMLVRKVLATNTQYITGMLVSNIFLVIQALVAVYTGIYFNNLTHLKSPEELFLYYAVGVAIINGFQRGNLVRRVEEEVENGDVAVHLTKPYNFIFQIICKDFATKVTGILVTGMVIIAIMSFIMGFHLPTGMQFVRMLFILPITIMFIYLSNGLFAQLALFWESAGWLVAIWGVSSFFLGGGLLPLEFMPQFANYIPPAFFFGSPLTYIATGIYPNVGIFITYIVITILANYFMYLYVRRRIQTNGG